MNNYFDWHVFCTVGNLFLIEREGKDRIIETLEPLINNLKVDTENEGESFNSV